MTLGKLTGDIHEFDYPNYIVIAISFFLESIFTLLILVEKKPFKKINEWLLILTLLYL